MCAKCGGILGFWIPEKNVVLVESLFECFACKTNIGVFLIVVNLFDSGLVHIIQCSVLHVPSRGQTTPGSQLQSFSVVLTEFRIWVIVPRNYLPNIGYCAVAHFDCVAVKCFVQFVTFWEALVYNL